MGIPGLHKYLSTISSGEVPVNFRASSDGTIKTLVVDGYGSLRKLYPSNLEWIHGGDWISLERNTKNFVNIFRLNGFKLVFMFDGNISKKKRSTWIARKKKDLKKRDQLFKLLRQGDPISKSVRQIPTGTGLMLRIILRSLGVDVYTTIGEADQQIACYCKRNSCYGILAEDSDFLAMFAKNGLPIRYYSLMHLKFKNNNITTILYNQISLKEKLKLKNSLFPLFATLSGNDYISVNKLIKFHGALFGGKFKKSNRSKIFELVALYLVKLYQKNSNTSELLAHVLENKYLRKIKNDILYSIAIYNINRKEALLDYLTTAIWCIEKYSEYHLGVCLEDPLENKTIAMIYRPIRENMYNFLQVKKVIEWGEYERMQDLTHPCIIETTNKFIDNKNQLKNLLTIWGVKSLPLISWDYYLPLILLLYLTKNRIITSEEKSKLLKLLVVKKSSNKTIYNNKINIRCIHLSSIIIKGIILGYETLQLCDSNIRFPNMLYFGNGVLIKNSLMYNIKLAKHEKKIFEKLDKIIPVYTNS